MGHQTPAQHIQMPGAGVRISKVTREIAIIDDKGAQGFLTRRDHAQAVLQIGAWRVAAGQAAAGGAIPGEPVEGLGVVGRPQRGAMRSAPSRRMVSPLR